MGRCYAEDGHSSNLNDAFTAFRGSSTQCRVITGYELLSVGIKHFEDIIADIEQTLAVV